VSTEPDVFACCRGIGSNVVASPVVVVWALRAGIGTD